ncbi:hypothetical protein [Clostridium sp. UBA1056]|uniref:hypothetical protein n=1 Tax=unclassified Clostridium TaxID=2614128 RepID=UPI003216E281
MLSKERIGKSAKSSALIYSIIETAKANNLIVEKYIVYLFDILSKDEVKLKEDILAILP